MTHSATTKTTTTRRSGIPGRPTDRIRGLADPRCTIAHPRAGGREAARSGPYTAGGGEEAGQEEEAAGQTEEEARGRHCRAIHVGAQDIGSDPSPEEIRRLCWQIQDSWSPAEERVRRLGLHLGVREAAEAETPVIPRVKVVPGRGKPRVERV